MVGFYLLLGVLGAPFFAGGSGFHHLVGATGGYLIGFAIAAALIGFLDRKHLSFHKQMAIYLGGSIIIYIPGLLQLKLITGSPWRDVLFMGLLPFIIGDLIKAVGACLGVRCTRRIMS
jgi:biotin transport system substrate-specific component